MERLRLKKPITIRLSYDKGIWCLENEELELFGCGKTLDEAFEDFKTVFESLVESYILEKDENLSDDALKLKKKLLEFLGDEKWWTR